MTAADRPRKLLFHIGHHKTGSTSIQYAFAAGRVKLEGGRILYPGRLNHNYLREQVEAFAREGRMVPGAPGAPNLATISERMRNGNFDVAVMSGEAFERADPRDVQRAMAEFLLPHVDDHRVICYVRPHAGRIVSSFAENVKIGLLSGQMHEFAQRMIRTGRLHYAQNLAPWRETFGARLLVRPMIRAELAGGDVLTDFVRTGFGADAPARLEPGADANETLCLEDLMILKLLQDRLGTADRALRHALGWDLAATLASTLRHGRPGTKLRLHRALAETLRTAFRADADAMDAGFFGGRPLLREDLDRSVDEALPEAQSLEPADHFSADALRVISVLLSQIALMLENGAGSWPQFLQDRRAALVQGAGPARPPEGGLRRGPQRRRGG